MTIWLSCSKNWVDISKLLASQKIIIWIKLDQRVYFALRLSKVMKFRRRKKYLGNFKEWKFFIFYFWVRLRGYIFKIFYRYCLKFVKFHEKIPGYFTKFQGIIFFQRFQGCPESVNALYIQVPSSVVLATPSFWPIVVVEE